MAQRSILLAIRQHHAVEHATLTLLGRRLRETRVAAHSDASGFILYGDVDAETLRAVAEEAMTRLQRGESALALHPQCGTNLVVAGLLSGAAAMLASSGRDRAWWDRLTSAVLGATLALLASARVGRWAQERITTSAAVTDLQIASVQRLSGPVTRHRVVIRQTPHEGRPVRKGEQL